LNAAELKVQSVVYTSGAGEQTAESITLDEEKEVLVATFNPPLAPGTGSLAVKFTGILNDKMKGFYRSQFKGPDGETRYNGVTQCKLV